MKTLESSQQDEWVNVLKAMADETRLRLLRSLFVEPQSVNHLAERLDISQYNVSKHLRILRESGLVTSVKQGKQRVYSLGSSLHTRLVENENILDLGCCAFRFDQLPE